MMDGKPAILNLFVIDLEYLSVGIAIPSYTYRALCLQ